MNSTVKSHFPYLIFSFADRSCMLKNNYKYLIQACKGNEKPRLSLSIIIKSSFEGRIYSILTSLYIRSSGAEGSSDVMVVICFASFNNCPSILTISPSIRTILCFSVYSGYSVVSLDVGGSAIFRLFYGTSRNAYYSVSETSLRKKLVL